MQFTVKSAYAVEGMEAATGAALIERLNTWIVQPRYVYRYEWQLDDLILWDNTGVLHRALAYGVNSKRLMHRTTVAGHEKPA
jgi:alpha-ketoglutarate-dependent taurine dioxygenase